jgi:hypothetical protein
MSYTKSTALAIKGDYSKNIDLPSDERYTSTTMKYYQKPLVRHEGEIFFITLDGTINTTSKRECTTIQDPASMTLDTSNM